MECSFCGKEEKDVKYLVMGPQVNICNECVLLAIEVIIYDSAKKSEEIEELKNALYLSEL